MDKNQLCHELAMAYVQAKINDAVSEHKFSENTPEAMTAACNMSEWYSDCRNALDSFIKE